jgi:hypothetical protein
MNKKLLLTLGLAALTAASTSFAADTKGEAKPDEKQPAAVTTEKKADDGRPVPFRGKVASVAPGGKSFTIKTRAGEEHTIAITADTVIQKDDAPAKAEDIKVDDKVRGRRVKKGANSWEAVRVIIGDKAMDKVDAAKAAQETPAQKP